MKLPGKIILSFFVLLCWLFNSNARQTSQGLPSLIDNQTNNNAGNDDTNAEVMLKQKMFVKVFTNKNKIFVGEPLMATYKFYVARQINDQPSVTKQPEFSGCSVKELNFEQGPEFENINNQTYATYTIRKVQLTPLQQGMLNLGKAYVDNFVELLNPDDPFVTKKYNISVSNSDASVEVNDLPEKNKPSSFYGITGIFKIFASAIKNKIPVGENGHLIVTIKGAGNIEAINQPDINWPSNTEHFDGNDSQHVDQDNFPVSGDRIFDIPFIGKKEGTVMIPPIRFSFFNTSSKNYETVTTDSIPITFTKALSKKQEFNDVVTYDITNRKYLWIIPALAMTVLLIGFISYQRNKTRLKKVMPIIVTTSTPAPVFAEPQSLVPVKYRTDFSYYLDELEKVTDNKEFFTMAKELLTKAVAERVDSTQYSEEMLMLELKERTYNAAVCNKAENLYEAINLNLYAPFETQADLGFYFNELKDTITELQKES